jgi:hypothetical protein
LEEASRCHALHDIWTINLDGMSIWNCFLALAPWYERLDFMKTRVYTFAPSDWGNLDGGWVKGIGYTYRDTSWPDIGWEDS